jgi:large subunit ribosomal protein L18
MEKSALKRKAREKRHRRVKKKIMGGVERPRLAVFRSNLHIYAQLIDNDTGRVLVSASSLDKEVGQTAAGKIESAKAVGKLLASRAEKAKIKQVVFDRGGYIYHGRVKALAEGAREGGMQF